MSTTTTTAIVTTATATRRTTATNAAVAPEMAPKSWEEVFLDNFPRLFFMEIDVTLDEHGRIVHRDLLNMDEHEREINRTVTWNSNNNGNGETRKVLWPCFLFPNYSVMQDELQTMQDKLKKQQEEELQTMRDKLQTTQDKLTDEEKDQLKNQQEELKTMQDEIKKQGTTADWCTEMARNYDDLVFNASENPYHGRDDELPNNPFAMLLGDWQDDMTRLVVPRLDKLVIYARGIPTFVAQKPMFDALKQAYKDARAAADYKLDKKRETRSGLWGLFNWIKQAPIERDPTGAQPDSADMGNQIISVACRKRPALQQADESNFAEQMPPPPAAAKKLRLPTPFDPEQVNAYVATPYKVGEPKQQYYNHQRNGEQQHPHKAGLTNGNGRPNVPQKPFDKHEMARYISDPAYRPYDGRRAMAVRRDGPPQPNMVSPPTGKTTEEERIVQDGGGKHPAATSAKMARLETDTDVPMAESKGHADKQSMAPLEKEGRAWEEDVVMGEETANTSDKQPVAPRAGKEDGAKYETQDRARLAAPATKIVTHSEESAAAPADIPKADEPQPPDPTASLEDKSNADVKALSKDIEPTAEANEKIPENHVDAAANPAEENAKFVCDASTLQETTVAVHSDKEEKYIQAPPQLASSLLPTPKGAKGRKIGQKPTQVFEEEDSAKELPPTPVPSKSNLLTDEERILPTFLQVKPYLEELGFSFSLSPTSQQKELYCFPHKDPKDPSAVEGQDYFTTEADFRNYLCAKGFKGIGNVMEKTLDTSSSSFKTLERWIRFAVVKTLINGRKNVGVVPEDNYPATNWTIKAKLGFTSSNGSYYLPNTDKKHATSNVDKFNADSALNEFLSKHGLPDSCYKRAAEMPISHNSLINLELFLAKYPRDVVQSEVRPCCRTRSARTGKDTPSPTNSSASSKASASAKEKRRRTKTPAPKGANKRSKTSQKKVETNVPSSPSPTLDCQQASPGSSQSVGSTNSAPSVQKLDKEAWVGVNQQVGGTFVKRSLIKKTLDYSEAVKVPEPVSASDKLMECLWKLKGAGEPTGAADDFVLGSNNSRLRTNTQLVIKYLERSVKGKLHGTFDNLKALYICGVPGVGKTSGVKWCCHQVLKKLSKDEDMTTKIVEINSAHIKSCTGKGTPMLVNIIGQQLGKKKTTEDSLLKSLGPTTSKKSKLLVILILDEIDLLVDESKTNTTNFVGSEAMISLLSDWSNRSDLRFTFIGIANSVNNSKYRRLLQIADFGQSTVTFGAYDRDQLVEIMQSRVGAGIVHPAAFQYVASKVAATSGDVRKAIEQITTVMEMVKLEVELCTRNNDSAAGPQNKAPHLVTLKDVIKHTASDYKKCSEDINDLPETIKTILCVAVAWAKKRSEVLTRKSLIRESMEALRNTISSDEIDPSGIDTSIEAVLDAGLLHCAENHSDKNADVLTLNYDLDSLQTVMEETFGNQPYFVNLFK